MQLAELIQRLSKLHEIHGDVAVMDQFECPVESAAFKSSGEYQDAPFVELVVGEPE